MGGLLGGGGANGMLPPPPLSNYWGPGSPSSYAYGETPSRYSLRELATDPSTSSYKPEPGRSKLTTSLVNVSLKFHTLISDIRQYFC